MDTLINLPDSSETPLDNPIDIPAITFCCTSCERIIGDSSALLFQTRSASTITFSSLVSIQLSSEPHVSPRGSWDEFCTFCTLHCGKCSRLLGRKYVATTAGLSRLQDRLTVDIDKMLVYQHGVEEPGLPVAERAEVIRLLHPEQDDVAHWVQACMSLCVVLKEEQSDIARGLKRLADVVGAEAGLETMGENGGQTPARLPSGTRILERLEILEGKMAAMSGDLERKVVEKPGKLEVLEKNLEGLEKKLGSNETLQKGMERVAALENELNTLKRAGCQPVTQTVQDHDNESVAGKALSAEPANNSAKKLKRKRVADVMIESLHTSAEPDAPGLGSSSDVRKQLGGKTAFDPENSDEGEPERHIRNGKSKGKDPDSSYHDVSDGEYREHPARHREPKRRTAAFEIPIGKDAGRRSTRTSGQGLGPAAKEERPRRSTNHRR